MQELRKNRMITMPKVGESWTEWQSRRPMSEIYMDALHDAVQRGDAVLAKWLQENPPGA